MAEVVVSELPLITQATLDDVFIINDGNDTTSSITWANMLASIQQLQGQVLFDSGSESLPSISFVNDINTGIYSPDLDEVAIVTSGVQRIIVNENGFVGISNRNPGDYNAGANNLVLGDVTQADNGLTIVSGNASAGIINFADGTGLAASEGQILYDHSDNHMEFQTDGRESMRITGQNDLLVGRSFPQTGARLLVTGGTIVTDRGDAAYNAYGFVDDPNTGMYSPAADTLALTTGAEVRAQITSDGSVGIGTVTPATHIHIVDEDPVITLTDDTDVNNPISAVIDARDGKFIIDVDSESDQINSEFKLGIDTTYYLSVLPTRHTVLDSNLYFGSVANGYTNPYAQITHDTASGDIVISADPTNTLSNSDIKFFIDGTSQVEFTQTGDLQITGNGNIIFDRDTDTYIGHPAENELAVTTNGTERIRFDSLGNLLIGSTLTRTVGGQFAGIQINGLQNKATISQVRYGADTTGATIRLGKSRATTVGAYGTVLNNDTVGEIIFHPADGTDLNGASASIKAQIDGVPGTDDVPGRLVFSTTAAGANSVTERMRVESTGDVGIGTNSPDSRLTIVNDNASSKSIAVKQSTTETFSVNNAGFVVATGYDIDTLPLLP